MQSGWATPSLPMEGKPGSEGQSLSQAPGKSGAGRQPAGPRARSTQMRADPWLSGEWDTGHGQLRALGNRQDFSPVHPRGPAQLQDVQRAGSVGGNGVAGAAGCKALRGGGLPSQPRLPLPLAWAARWTRPPPCHPQPPTWPCPGRFLFSPEETQTGSCDGAAAPTERGHVPQRGTSAEPGDRPHWGGQERAGGPSKPASGRTASLTPPTDGAPAYLWGTAC